MRPTDHALGGPLPSLLPAGAPDLLAAFWTMTSRSRSASCATCSAWPTATPSGRLVRMMAAGKITRRRLLELV